MNDLTHLSLFTGIGGIDLAAEWAGFKTVGQVERDHYALQILQRRFGRGIPRWADIKELSADDFRRKTGITRPTIITGGFPCQPFSCAGKRKGKGDDRYLWPEMFRVLQELRPPWVIGENVAGIINMELPNCIADLESENYQVRTFIIPACSVGAPHKRERVFIVAHCECTGGGGVHPQGQWIPENSDILCKETGTVGNSKHNGCPHIQDPEGFDRGGNHRQEGEDCTRQPPGPSCCGGGDQDVAHSISDGSQNRYKEAGGEEQGGSNGGMLKLKGACKTIPHSHSTQTPRLRQYCREMLFKKEKRLGKPSPPSWWITEPPLGRVVDGIPHRVDRIKCLGNAVVPQQIYPILACISQIENEVRE